MENAERAKRVLADMQTRFDKEDYAGVASLKEDIEMCLHVCAEDSTCAEIACLLATAKHAAGGYTLAIYYFEVAFCLQTGLKLAPLAAASDPSRPRPQGAPPLKGPLGLWGRGGGSLSGRDILQPPDDVMSAFTGDCAKTQRDNLTMARVCGGMGNACAAVGAFAEAQPWFVQCVELRKHIESAPAAMLQYVFMVAQNLHALRLHQEAIQMIQTALDHAQRAGSEGRDSGDVSNYDVAYKSSICPTLLLGRCYTAIGKYPLALKCLQQACAQSNASRDPTFMVTAHLEFAVTGWVYQKCLDADIIKKRALYCDADFLGPPLSHTMVQRHVVQLAAADCIQAQGAGGATDLCILLNANGDPTSVRRFHIRANDPNDPQIDLVVQVHWDAVDSVQVDHATAPLLLPLQIQGPDGNMYAFGCVFVRSVSFELGDAGSSESRQCTVAGVGAEQRSLTDFLTRCVSLTQIGDAEERAQGMAIVTAALTKARHLTWEHNLVKLQEDSLIFMCFCGIDVGVDEERIFRSLKNFLQSQVDAAKKEPNPTCLTCNQACTAVCGGCTVMRFCDKNHQRQSSSMPFFGTKGCHKTMCPLLFLCKSLSRSDAGGTAAVQLAQQYDEALRQFLRTDFFGQYVKNSDFELD